MPRFLQNFLAAFSFICLAAISTSPAQAEVAYEEECLEGTQTALPVCKWQDSEAGAKGAVVLIHGITQRAYSLNVLARQLAESGFVVYGVDQRGHGRWHFDQNKREQGFKCNFKQTVKDVDKLLPAIKESHPNIPLFLVGESAGAGVAIRAAADSPDMVRGVVLAGTGCKPGRAKLTWVIGDILSNFYRGNHQINVVRYQKRYGTDDLAALEESLKDEYQRPTMSLNELLRAAKFMKSNAKFARRISPDTSVLVIQGCEDKVLKPKSAERVLAKIPSQDKRIVKVEKCGHILLGTNHVKPLVSRSIENWLERGAGTTTVASATGVVTR